MLKGIKPHGVGVNAAATGSPWMRRAITGAPAARVPHGESGTGFPRAAPTHGAHYMPA
jgi:hypothetical protein